MVGRRIVPKNGQHVQHVSFGNMYPLIHLQLHGFWFPSSLYGTKLPFGNASCGNGQFAI